MAGTLYLVGTPIGNLGDISERARDTLARVDVVAAEDTRRSGRLLASLGVDARLVSLFEGNEQRRTDELLRLLEGGADVAVVSDAGMPTVSDPGFRLVRACAERDIDVRVVPGPSSVIAALAVSGLPTDRFVFEGFLPRKPSERRRRLMALRDDPRTVVVFESAPRLGALLRDVLAELGDRRVAVARELTKLHEEVLRGRASELAERIHRDPPRGETVVVLEGGRPPAPSLDELVREARARMASGLRARQAASEVARARGGSSNQIYRALVARRAEHDAEEDPGKARSGRPAVDA